MSLPLPRCAPTMIGSLPHTEPQAAVGLVDRLLVEVPALPELPRLGPDQQMIAARCAGLPGLAWDADHRPYIDTARPETPLALAAFFERALAAEASGQLQDFALDAAHAAALEPFCRQLAARPAPPAFIKMQLAGPVTFALGLKDESGRPLFFDDTWRDALSYQIRLQAAWLLKQLGPLGRQPVVFLDEPSLAAFGSSAYIGVGREQVMTSLRPLVEDLKARGALVGTHVCGNTDWAMLADCGLDILNGDVFSFGRQFVLEAGALRGFLQRGGLLAWGVVPNDERVRQWDVTAMQRHLLELVDALAGGELSRSDILARSFITPACGLAALGVDQAQEVLARTVELATRLRQSFLSS